VHVKTVKSLLPASDWYPFSILSRHSVDSVAQDD